MMTTVVDISIHDAQWLELQTKKTWQRELKDFINQLCTLQSPWLKKGEVNIILTNDQEIQQHNAQYRSKDQPTNVLSFGYCDVLLTKDDVDPRIPVLLGDIILSFQTLRREAIQQQKDFKHHIYHMVIHGWLHLLGYDHENDHDANVMESLEINLLHHFGIKNPYFINHA